jgi:hypothetical protein
MVRRSPGAGRFDSEGLGRQERRINRFWTSLALILTLGLVVVPTATAHKPIGPGNNESLASATLIPDSTKSWAVYADLHKGGEAQYYKFEATGGEKVPIQLYTSPSKQDAGFTPSFVLMGPGIPDKGSVPSYVETPAGAGHMVITGTRPAQATYEAFSPSVYVQVAEASLEAPADGTYYVAVYDDERGGHYGVAIGDREAFTPYQWIVTPLAFSSIYAWEGRSLFLVYAPAFLIVVLGLGLLIRRQRRRQRLDLVGWLAAIAGLLFLGSGATVASQMAVSLMRSTPDALVVATVILATLPIVVSVLTLHLAMRRSGRWTLGSRIYLALLGVVALVIWAGWLVGPGLAIVAALVPSAASPEPATGVEA